jgi:hypothetical protein
MAREVDGGRLEEFIPAGQAARARKEAYGEAILLAPAPELNSPWRRQGCVRPRFRGHTRESRPFRQGPLLPRREENGRSSL